MINDDLINFEIPVNKSSIIKVIGVGGGGTNAVNYMYRKGIKDVTFVVCNTDVQSLQLSPVPCKIKLGTTLTEGLGAGNNPEIGKQAAIENLTEIIDLLSANTKMVFITAGMGGGTGTGAAPVIAKAARELNILTVAVVTIPFRSEGLKRFNQAIEGIAELEKYVDSLLVINNNKLREIYGVLKMSESFARADDVLATAVKGIAEIITVPGYINVDFADVYTVMAKSGVAIMGTGIASGENRSIKAVQQALTSPLLNNNEIKGAANILLNINYGKDEITMDEFGEITDYINNEVGAVVDIIWGICQDEKLGDDISITIIATGFKSNSIPELYSFTNKKEKILLHPNVSENKNNESFIVKETNNVETEIIKIKQGIIEFDIKDSGNYKTKDKEATEIYNDSKHDNNTERIKKIKQTRRQYQESVLNFSLENLDEIENIPAYKRKNMKIDDIKHSDDNPVSRVSIKTDDENNIHIKTNNSYLHDNVD
jgi:cell division protein FtsZ